jgi:hypothetical protein
LIAGATRIDSSSNQHSPQAFSKQTTAKAAGLQIYFSSACFTSSLKIIIFQPKNKDNKLTNNTNNPKKCS